MKHRLVKLGLLLLLGAIMNVAVAWGCAAWSGSQSISKPLPVVPFQISQKDIDQWLLMESARSSGDFLWNDEYPAFGVIRTVSHESVIHYGGFEPVYDERPSFICTRAGWPYTSFEGYQSLSASLNQPIVWNCVDGIELKSRIVPASVSLALIPLKIRYLSFCANSVLYATLLWSVLAGPIAVRRTVRRARSLCPNCAYPIRSSAVCTECGKPVRA